MMNKFTFIGPAGMLVASGDEVLAHVGQAGPVWAACAGLLRARGRDAAWFPF
jgi:hypothetical protein